GIPPRELPLGAPHRGHRAFGERARAARALQGGPLRRQAPFFAARSRRGQRERSGELPALRRRILSPPHRARSIRRPRTALRAPRVLRRCGRGGLARGPRRDRLVGAEKLVRAHRDVDPPQSPGHFTWTARGRAPTKIAGTCEYSTFTNGH